jgi:hypothetical protein
MVQHLQKHTFQQGVEGAAPYGEYQTLAHPFSSRGPRSRRVLAAAKRSSRSAASRCSGRTITRSRTARSAGRRAPPPPAPRT